MHQGVVCLSDRFGKFVHKRQLPQLGNCLAVEASKEPFLGVLALQITSPSKDDRFQFPVLRSCLADLSRPFTLLLILHCS